MVQTANQIWRDFETDGVPASGVHRPIKADIRAWGTDLEAKRQTLTAARSYYMRTDGNDANDGLSNTAGGAFATLEGAFTTIIANDNKGNTVTLNVGPGTYTDGLDLGKYEGWIGNGLVLINGDTTTPGNVFFNCTGSCFNILGPCRLGLQGLKLASSTAYGINVEGGGSLVDVLGNMHWGNIAVAPMRASRHGRLEVHVDTHLVPTVGWTYQNIIAASHYGHFRQDAAAVLWCDNNFALDPSIGRFADSDNGDIVFTSSAVVGGAATVTGKRFKSINGGLIQVAGTDISRALTFFPGTIPGDTFAEYVGATINRGALRPPQITADTNNWNPLNSPDNGATMQIASTVYFSTDASRNITGLVATQMVDGQDISLVNIGAQNAVLKHMNASSAAANRFFLPGLADLTLTAGSAVKLKYDGTAALWRLTA